MKFSFTIILIVGLSFTLNAQTQNFNSYMGIQSLKYEISNPKNLSPIQEFTPRRITGLVYSTLLPGTGQYYLGHRVKGALMTVGFIGSLLTTVVSHNNFVSNGERIENLKFDYLNAERYSTAENYWKTMNEVYIEQKDNAKRRDIFIIVTGGIWLLNILDYLFLSDDLGVTDFAYINSNSLTINQFSSILSFQFPF